MNLRRLALFVLYLFIPLLVYAQPFPEAVELLRRYEQRPGVRATALLRDLETGETLVAHRTDELFRPASLVKIPTTGAFLALRGADYRFHIPVAIRGRVHGGVLEGDLILGASADPSVGSHYIPEPDRLLREVKTLLEERGIKRVTGRLVLDMNGFPRPFANDTWPEEDLDEYYGALVSGFNVGDNYADLYLYTEESDPEVEVQLASQPLPTRQSLTTGSPTNLELTMPVSRDSILVSGEVRSGSSGRHQRWALPDPPLYAALWLTEGLRQRGIELPQAPRLVYDSVMTGLDTLGFYTSLPVDTLVKITNFRSSNIYAEALAYSLNSPKDRTTGYPIAMRDYWRERLHLTPSNFLPMDGSGLSPYGRLTSGALSLILSELWRDQALNAPFLASLPEAGVEGSVRSVSLPSEIRAFVKSGSMRGVRGYAGYIHHEGKWYSIVYIANGAITGGEARSLFTHFVSCLFIDQPLPDLGPKKPSTVKTKKKVQKAGKTKAKHSKRKGKKR